MSLKHTNMVSLEMETTPVAAAAAASPRISFSSDFLNDCNFITINLTESMIGNPDHFEFLSGDVTSHPTISTADELFFEGKLLPFWHNQETEKQGKIIRVEEKGTILADKKENEEGVKKNWFVDDDPSPRPPKCSVLWKELLRLKKQRAPSYLSPSSSSSGGCELAEKEKKRLERSRSGRIVRSKSNALPPLFPQGGSWRHK